MDSTALRKDRLEKLDVVVGNGNEDRAQPELGEILLMFQILIDRYKDIEALLRKRHKFAVGGAAPAPSNRTKINRNHSSGPVPK